MRWRAVPRRWHWSRLALGLPLAVLLLLLTVRPAVAHDELVGSTPANGARVTGASLAGQVVLHFEEPPLAIGAQVRVTGPTGTISTGEPRIHGSDLVQPLSPSIAAGSYTVVWRITSDDGHVVSGSIPFTVTRATSGSAPAGSPAAGSATQADPSSTAQSTGAAWPFIAGLVVLVAIIAVVLAGVARRRQRAR